MFPVPATVSFENDRPHDMQATKNARSFERAIFFLSQSELGRQLLTRIGQEGIRFVYDPKTTRERFTALINDRPSKTILMEPETEPMDLAAFLAHESQHVVQNNNSLYYLSGDTLLTAIAITLAQEADARVAVVICVYQCIMSQPGDNPARFKMKIPEGFWERILPDNVAKAAKEVEPYARQGDWKTLAQIIYDAFQRDEEAVANYTVRTLDAFLGWFPQQTEEGEDESIFMVNQRIDREGIEKTISLGGMRYLMGSNPYRADYALSRDKRVQERCAILKQKIEALGPYHLCRPVIDWEPCAAQPIIVPNVIRADKISPRGDMIALDMGRNTKPGPSGLAA
jgi:hypothetical protein